MATGPIETHLHHSFNWENGAPGAREGPRGRSVNCGSEPSAQCVRLRSEINQKFLNNSALGEREHKHQNRNREYDCSNNCKPIKIALENT